MRSLFWLLAVFAAAVTLAILGRVDQGYALLVAPPYRVELSMLMFAVVLLAGFALLYVLVRLAHHALGLPERVRAYRERRRSDHARSALAAALQAYFEGRYARAEKEAGLAYAAGASPGLAALIAARASHQMRNFERREQWFERSAAAGEPLQVAHQVTRAELALEERDFAAARDALRGLHGSGPRHIATLRMLLRAERGAGNWEEVLHIGSQLAKRDAIAPALAEEYRLQATIELLARASPERAAFEERWKRIPPRDQAHPRVAAAGARHAAALGAAALARDILERSLAAEWSPALAALYGELPAAAGPEEARARIERAEKWLAAHPDDPQLLAMLGRLCARAELWGKAQSCLEASLSFEESRAAHLELARLAERVGRAAEAQRHYRRATELP